MTGHIKSGTVSCHIEVFFQMKAQCFAVEGLIRRVNSAIFQFEGALVRYAVPSMPINSKGHLHTQITAPCSLNHFMLSDNHNIASGFTNHRLTEPLRSSLR